MMLPPGTFGKEKSSPTAFGVFQVSYGRAFTTFLVPNHFSLVGDWLLSNIELILVLSRRLTSSKIPWSRRRRNCVRGGSRTGVTLLCNSLTFKPWARGDCFWVSRILQSHRNLLMSNVAITRHSYKCRTLHYKCRLEATADNSRQTCHLDIFLHSCNLTFIWFTPQSQIRLTNKLCQEREMSVPSNTARPHNHSH